LRLRFIRAAEFGWTDLFTATSFVSAVVFFVSFSRIEARHPAPLLHPSLLRDGVRLSALAVMALIVGMHLSLLFMLVHYLQVVLGLNPLLAGLAYIPLTATVFVVSRFTPWLIARWARGYS